MTTYQKITYIKSLCEETDEDVLSTYLTLAENIAESHVFPFGSVNQNVMSRYDPTICEIAVYLINKRGAEGEKAHSESTAERTYENGGVPDSILKKLTPFCGGLR